MSIWKKAVSVTASAALLASLLGTAAVATVGVATVAAATPTCDNAVAWTDFTVTPSVPHANVSQNGPYGTAFSYCTNVTSRPADGTSYIILAFNTPQVPAGLAVENISVTGGTFIFGSGSVAVAQSPTLTYPRTQILVQGGGATALNDQLWLASSTTGTATVTISYSTGTTLYDSVQSFTFTSASINTPSTALSTSKIYNGVNTVSSPASAAKAAGDSGLSMLANVVDNSNKPIATGVTVEWTISGPAYFCANPCTGGGSYKSTATAAANGSAQSLDIWSTGAGGTATVTSTVKYLGVSYALPDKTINFVGDPAKIVVTNGYYSIDTGGSQGPAYDGKGNECSDTTPPVSGSCSGDGAIEAVVTDANGFIIQSGLTFSVVSPTPAAFWTYSGESFWDSGDKATDLGVQCGSTAGTNTAQIKAALTSDSSKSVTSDAITLTCADELTTVDLGTLSVDTSGGTTVQPGGQLAINASVKDDNGLPAPDGGLADGTGTLIQAATNGFGTIVRVTKATNEKGTVNGVAKFLYLAPSTPGTAVITFFGNGVTTPSNVSVTVTVGGAITGQVFGASVKGGASTQGALSSSVCSASCSGAYGTATPVVKPGQYISWKATVGGTYAGKTAYVWVSKKNSSGVWSSWSLLTSRIADNAGTVIFNWKLTSASWDSVMWSTSNSSSDFMTVLHSVARQGRWK